jgi:uncharacterized protein YcgI (DUF1989 family)
MGFCHGSMKLVSGIDEKEGAAKVCERLGKINISGKIIQEVTIPAREHLGLVIRKGQIVRIIDAEGKQCADVL